MTITSKTPLQISAIEFLLKQDSAVYESHLDGEIQVVKYSPQGKYPVAAIFQGKQKAPFSLYRYSSEERREQAIKEAIDSYLSTQKWKADRKAKAKKVELEVNDIVYTSWGYDETHVDFYLIVGLVGKSTAEYVAIGSKQVKETSWCSADVSPDPSRVIGKIQRGRIGEWGVKIGDHHASKTSVNSKHHSSWGY